MGKTLAYKILDSHKVSEDIKNNTISIKIDQTLNQDATGTMAYLEYNSIFICNSLQKLMVIRIHKTIL